MRIDPETVMTTVVALIILAVGVFAFFVFIQDIPITNIDTEWIIQEITNDESPILNVISIVLIIGAIMTTVGLVYSLMRPSYDDSDDSDDDDIIHSNLPIEKSTKPIKVKSKSKIKKKDSFEWGN